MILMPPFIITLEEIDKLLDVTYRCIETITRVLKRSANPELN